MLVSAQNVADARVLEIEASKQTEKLQKELNLTDEQTSKIYEINLKYARERKSTNRRTDAVNLIKSKNNEIEKVLTPRQVNDLRNIRTEPLSVEIDGKQNFMRTDGASRVNNYQREISGRQSRATVDTREASRRENRMDENTRSGTRPTRQTFNSESPARSSSTVSTRERSQTQRESVSDTQQRRSSVRNEGASRSATQQSSGRNR